MPNLTPLVLTDRSDNSQHTFVPREISNGVSTLVEGTGLPIGDRRITVSLTRKPTGGVKATLKLAIPVLGTATVNGVTRQTVTHSNYADVTFSFDGTSTKAEREGIISMLASSLGSDQTMMMSVLEDLNGLY